MATGDTNIKITNGALILLGSDEITSFTDGSDAAKMASQLYPDVKNMALGLYDWSFALKKKTLARSATAPINEWTYSYPLPADILTKVPQAVYNSTSTGVSPITAYEIYDSSIYTGATTIVIDYLSTETTEASMPSYFVQLLKYMMAWHLAEPVTDQAAKAKYWQGVAVGEPHENMRGGFFRQAAQMDGRGRPSKTFSDREFSLYYVRNI